MADNRPTDFEKPKLPKLNVPEQLKFRDILQRLIASIEIRIEELNAADMPKVALKWKRNSLKWLKHQRAAYVWLDNVISRQKDYGNGEP